MTPLSEAEASAVWAVLVEHAHAGAVGYGRSAFVVAQTSNVAEEYRFIGSLGFGGKFRRNRVWIGPDLHETWTVDCYPEDVTPERQNTIDATNKALAELHADLARRLLEER